MLPLNLPDGGCFLQHSWKMNGARKQVNLQTSHALWFDICKVEVFVVHSCPTPCSPLGSSIHGVLQARALEWAATSFCKGSSHPVNEPPSRALAGRSFITESPGKPTFLYNSSQISKTNFSKSVYIRLSQSLVNCIEQYRSYKISLQ